MPFAEPQAVPVMQRGRLEDALFSDSQDGSQDRSRSIRAARPRAQPRFFNLPLSDEGLAGTQRLQQPPFEKIPLSDIKVPKHIKKLVDQKSQNFRKHLDEFTRANTQHIRENAQLQHFVENKEGYPAGIHPFTMGASVAELDENWSCTATGGHTMQIFFPPGCSRRSAGQILHAFWIKTWKSIECEATQSRVAELRKRVDPNCLLEDVLEAYKAQPLEDEDLASQYMPNPFEEFPRARLEALVFEKYRQLYRNFNKDLQQRANQAETERKKREELDESVLRSNPKTLFECAVSESVASILKKSGLIAEEGEALMDDTTDKAAEFVNSLASKNDISPLLVGHNASSSSSQDNNNNKKPKQKAKAKAKAKQNLEGNVSKGSGRGKGRNGPRGGKNL